MESEDKTQTRYIKQGFTLLLLHIETCSNSAGKCWKLLNSKVRNDVFFNVKHSTPARANPY